MESSFEKLFFVGFSLLLTYMMTYASFQMQRGDSMNNNTFSSLNRAEMDGMGELQPMINSGWVRVVLVLVLVMVLSAFTSLVMAIFAGIPLETFELPINDVFEAIGINMTILFMLLQFIAMFLIVIVFRIFVDRQSILSLGFAIHSYKMDLLKGIACGGGLIIIGFLLLYIFDLISITSVNLNNIEFASYITLFIIVALNEEIFVRGYISNNLMSSTNKITALIFSSAIFSLLHLSNDHVTFVFLINVFLAGIMLGIYTVHTGNLWFSIGMHFSWNFFQGPILGFAVSGLKVDSVISQKIEGNVLITGGDSGFEGSLLLTLMMIISTLLIHIRYKQKQLASS